MRLPIVAQLLLPALLLTATPALAQQVREGKVEGISAPRLFQIADQAIASGHLADAETIYRALVRDPDIEIRSEARFRLGMMLEKQKRYTEAATLFRQILDEKPKASRVRLELARILALIGDEGAARRELRQVQASGLPPQVALVVDQFANALRSRKPLGGSVEKAIAPDSNINRATRAKTLNTIIAPLNLSRDARERSGIGVRLSGQGYVRLPLSGNLALLPRISTDATLYRQSAFNDISGSALLGIEYRSGADRATLSAGPTFRWYGDRLYARTATASATYEHPISRRAEIEATLTTGHSDYRQNDQQNGMLYDARLALDRAFSARSGGEVSLGVTRQTARDPGYATTSGGVSLLYWRELGHTTLFSQLSAHRLGSDERLFLFPERRREWLYSANLGATFRAFTVHGFAPVVRVHLERNASSVGIYDYRRIAFDFGITRAF